MDFIQNFTLTFSRPQSILRDEIAYTLFEQYTEIPHLRVMTVPLEGINRAIYLDSTFLKELFKRLLASIETEEKWELHLKRYRKLADDIKMVGDEVSGFKGSNKQEISTLYQKGLDVMVRLGDYAWIPIPIEKELAPRFIELLKKKHPEDWESINEAISSPIKLYCYQKMRLDICEAVISGQTESREVIKSFVAAHSYQGEYSYVEPLFEDEYFITECAKLSIEGATLEKERINEQIETNIEKVKQAFAKLQDPILIHQAHVINEYTFLRTDRVDLLKKIQVPIRGLLDKVAEHLACDTGKLWTRIDVVNLLNQEIFDYLGGISIPDIDDIAERKKGVYYRTRTETKVFTDPDLVRRITEEMNKNSDKKIKGLIAYKGVARGTVKMVFSKADLPKVKKGDIMVSRTTMPDYTPAMEIAAAFVTEEGGITSHAAIIARELKRPCIVGTGNCTKILKDGDLVEVDATNGIVTILAS